MKTFRTFFCDCTVSTDLTAFVSTSSLTLNLCKLSSWSERKWTRLLCPFPPFLVGVNPREMDIDLSIKWPWCQQLLDREPADSLGLGVTDVPIHYGPHSTYGTNNGQLVWWMTPVSRGKEGRYIAHVFVWLCVCMHVYVLRWLWMAIMQFSHLINA